MQKSFDHCPGSDNPATAIVAVFMILGAINFVFLFIGIIAVGFIICVKAFFILIQKAIDAFPKKLRKEVPPPLLIKKPPTKYPINKSKAGTVS